MGKVQSHWIECNICQNTVQILVKIGDPVPSSRSLFFKYNYTVEFLDGIQKVANCVNSKRGGIINHS